MARDTQIVLLCDPCDQSNLSGIEAVATHLIALDGMPMREVDMCARDEALFLRVYASGRDLPVSEPPKATPAQPKPKPKELTKAPAKEASASAEAESRQVVVCPLSHPTEDGGKREISYKDRASHTDQCHPGMKAWDIEWEDPHGILEAYCTEHDFCKHYGFTSQRGVSQHINAMRKYLKEEEGAPQKSDEPAANAEHVA